MYWFLFQIAWGLICLFFMDTARPGSPVSFYWGSCFCGIALFLLVWKNGDRAVRWLAG